MIVASFYEEAYMFKPFFSRSSNSERYLVVKGFKYSQTKDKKFLDQQLEILEEVLTKMNVEKFTMDIFEDLEIPTKLKQQFIFINKKIANVQQIMINKIVKYIKGNNYFGEDFHNYKDNQMKAVNWWVATFYPESKGYKEALQKNTKEFARMVNYNMKEIENFSKQLVTN